MSVLTEVMFREAWDRALDLVMNPSPPPVLFVSQREFRLIVELAEELGVQPFSVVRVIVHPDSLRWYQERIALARLRVHFGMLDS